MNKVPSALSVGVNAKLDREATFMTTVRMFYNPGHGFRLDHPGLS
jgi:hypothetical protein